MKIQTSPSAARLRQLLPGSPQIVFCWDRVNGVPVGDAQKAVLDRIVSLLREGMALFPNGVNETLVGEAEPHEAKLAQIGAGIGDQLCILNADGLYVAASRGVESRPIGPIGESVAMELVPVLRLAIIREAAAAA